MAAKPKPPVRGFIHQPTVEDHQLMKPDSESGSWKAVWCAKHHFLGEKCGCPPGPQIITLNALVDELLMGGARGGLKTETGIAYLMTGNPGEPCTHLPNCPVVLGMDVPCRCGASVNISYLNSRFYRALVLRRNATDLMDWASRAMRLYSSFGAALTVKPTVISFPTGAQIILGHLSDAESYEHHQGSEYHRMIIEELTQIPSLDLFEKTLMSNRSKWECKKGCPNGTCRCGKLRASSFNSTNPLGPGHGWVFDRFINLNDQDGNPWPVNTVWTDPKTKRTRMFVPSTVEDNPYISEGYRRQLEGISNPIQMRAWRYGEWNIGGNYFEEFRPKGPLDGESDDANHVYQEGTLKFYPWWPVDIGVDWGFSHNTACLWGVVCPDTKRLYVDREFVINKLSSFDLGVEIALRSVDYLSDRENAINMWLSHEVFDTRDASKTIAQQIEAGINSVLGRDASFLIDTRDMTDEEMILQLNMQRKSRITIRRAKNQRISGWGFLHDLMRWKRMALLNTPSFSEGHFTRLLHETGAEAAMTYQRLCSTRNVEVLPRLLISSGCKKVIAGISKAQPNPPERGNPEDVLKNADDNEIDALRYLAMGARFSMVHEPTGYHVDQKIQRMIDASPGQQDVGALILARKYFEAQYAKEKAPDMFNVPRMAGRRFREMQATI